MSRPNVRWPGHNIHTPNSIAQKAIFDQLCVVADLLRVLISRTNPPSDGPL